MNQDEQNLNLLSIFHYVLGGLTCLGSLMFLFHIGMGIAMLTGAFHDHDAPDRVFGWLFLAMGSFAVLCGETLGVLMIVAGRKLRARTSRIFCLVIAALECFMMPWGTVLGVFTIIMLVKESVVQLFAANENPSAVSP